jgi:hypothetical protein
MTLRLPFYLWEVNKPLAGVCHRLLAHRGSAQLTKFTRASKQCHTEK